MKKDDIAYTVKRLLKIYKDSNSVLVLFDIIEDILRQATYRGDSGPAGAVSILAWAE